MMESLIGVVAFSVVGLLVLWLLRSAETGGREVAGHRAEPARCVVVPEPGLEGIWARHPLDPERGWCVATNGGVPVEPGDEVRVRRRDGSRSFETVRRVVLELHEPEGDVVGHLVEVENVE